MHRGFKEHGAVSHFLVCLFLFFLSFSFTYTSTNKKQIYTHTYAIKLTLSMNNILNTQELPDELQRRISPPVLRALNELLDSTSFDSRQRGWTQFSSWLCWLEPKLKKSLLKQLVSRENHAMPARCLRVFLDAGCATNTEEMQILFHVYAKRASSFENPRPLWNIVLDAFMAGLAHELRQSLPSELWKDVQQFPLDQEVQHRWKTRFSQLAATPVLLAKAHAFFVFRDMRNGDSPDSLALITDLKYPTDSPEFTTMYYAYARNLTGYELHDQMWEEVRTLIFPVLLNEINFSLGRWAKMTGTPSWQPLLTELSNIDPTLKPKFYEALVLQDFAGGEARRDPQRPHLFLALKNLGWPTDSEEWQSLYYYYHRKLDGAQMFRGLWLRILKLSQERLAWETCQVLPDNAWSDIVKYFRITSLKNPAKRQARYPTWALGELHQNPLAKDKFYDYLAQFDLEFDYPYSACFLLTGHDISIAYERNMTEYDKWRLVTALIRSTGPDQAAFIEDCFAPESTVNVNNAYKHLLPDPLYITSAVKREAYARFKPFAASATQPVPALPALPGASKSGDRGRGDAGNSSSPEQFGVIMHILGLISLQRQGTSVTALLAVQERRGTRRAPLMKGNNAAGGAGATGSERPRSERMASWFASLKLDSIPRKLKRRTPN